jgi:hypothetical protein
MHSVLPIYGTLVYQIFFGSRPFYLEVRGGVQYVGGVSGYLSYQLQRESGT